MATNPDPSIDLMALADIGGNPMKLAQEVHRQLRLQYGSVPHDVPLDGIAKSVGIEDIVDHQTEAFEGTLFVNGSRGIVGLRKGMRLGRRRFTLGHELGHFLNPWHSSAKKRFECSSNDTRMLRASGGRWVDRPPLEKMEIEANEFSNALLIPAPEYREARRLLGGDPSIEHIRSLADMFKVSFEVMCQTFVNTEKETVGIILSRNGLVVRPMLPRSFPYLGMSKGTAIPSDSNTADFQKSASSGDVSTLADALNSSWLERKGNVSGLYEQAYIQRDGWAVTLLWAEIEEQDEEANDQNWNRGSSRRWA